MKQAFHGFLCSRVEQQEWKKEEGGQEERKRRLF
jgi:hypothetical protein